MVGVGAAVEMTKAVGLAGSAVGRAAGVGLRGTGNETGSRVVSAGKNEKVHELRGESC